MAWWHISEKIKSFIFNFIYMAKYSKCSEEVENLVKEIADELGLGSYGVDFQALCVPKSKVVCKVKRANDLAEYVSSRENLVFVLVYEEAFDALGFDEEANKTKYLWLRSEMEQVSYDAEKDKVNIGCPTITLPESICEKFGNAAINAARLGVHTIAKIEQDKKEEAEQKKALRTKKGKRNSEYAE